MTIYLSAEIPGKALDWRNDKRVNRWCRQYRPITVLEHARWLDKIDVDPTIQMFGIHDGKTALGVCGLTSIDMVNRNAEFSLYIDPDEAGEGYGKQALKVLLKFGFHALGLHRIWGEVFDGNPAMEMFIPLGFDKEGTSFQSYYRDGKYINSERIAILAEEFVL